MYTYMYNYLPHSPLSDPEHILIQVSMVHEEDSLQVHQAIEKVMNNQWCPIHVQEHVHVMYSASVFFLTPVSSSNLNSLGADCSILDHTPSRHLQRISNLHVHVQYRCKHMYNICTSIHTCTMYMYYVNTLLQHL